MTATDDTRAQVQLAALAAIGAGAEELVALDVSGQLPFADAFLIMSGRSERNVSAIADAVEDKLGEAGTRVKRREGAAEGRWALIDFGDTVVHVFHPEERDYYSLERLWKDCPVIPLEEALAR
ncbi:ribosome silencing factor [Paramicrobacterium fandaimingii]|uniref:ribosome silencing factor n=1 Tax=Paramicrobacterium fandaimingii TaxID=2708079 RepID=UPI0014229729|nr:ribosome silencing factor [Microbacterium fandaimingii]